MHWLKVKIGQTIILSVARPTGAAYCRAESEPVKILTASYSHLYKTQILYVW